MSTKFILVGGYVQKASDGGKEFCEEFVADFSGPVKILICPFAVSESEWRERLEKEKNFFDRYLPNVSHTVKLATVESFGKDLMWCDCVYFTGGNTRMLKNILERYNNFRQLLIEKTVAGSSAGADVLTKYNFNVDEEFLDAGLGLLPIKTITHFKAPDYKPGRIDWDRAYYDLKNYQEDLPIVALGEGEYKVVSI